jgi:hypothetical protein
MMPVVPSEILVSESMQTATATEFAFATYPALRIKGKTDTQAVFAVLGEHQCLQASRVVFRRELHHV